MTAAADIAAPPLTRKDRCDYCHMIGEVMDLPDPFMAEIHPGQENEPSKWCDACYQESVDAI